MNSLKKLIALVMILTVANIASASNGEFTVAGATQFDWFFSFGDNFPAATHDYIDVDGDGIALINGPGASNTQQLAAEYNVGDTFAQLLVDGPWVMNYRGTGSGTGLIELIDWHGVSVNSYPTLVEVDGSVNRWTYNNDPGASTPKYYPFEPLENGIDIATMDVPTTQFVTVGSEDDAFFGAHPTQPGYGMSPVTPWDADSTNKLADTGGLNTNTEDPDAQTIFDFPMGWLPFVFVAARSTGLENVTVDELACMYTTGRAPCGINYTVGTRHSGSGSRNACMSSIGVDPSWGRGDNLGQTDKGTDLEILGPAHQASNITSSSTLRDIQSNDRFMISYQSLHGSKGTPKINAGWYECLNVSFDCGQTYVRPEENVSLSEIPDFAEVYNNGLHPTFQANVWWPNASNGWKIGGSETFATVGHPYGDLGSHPYISAYNDANYAGLGMANVDAAEFIVNLVESIGAVQDLNGIDPSLEGTPGQALAYKSMLTYGVYGLPNPKNPTEFIVSDDYNPGLTGLPIDNFGLNAYGGGSLPYGRLPDRDTDGDGDADGDDAAYVTLISGTTVTQSNIDAGTYALQGDIDGNGSWTSNDLELAVDINELGSGASVADISYDILCDFDGDGWFTAEDVRYMADGLILSAAPACACCGCDEIVNREVNFKAVDNASTSGNFFGCILANGSYDAGDCRGDIAKLVGGEVYAQAGAAPVGDNSVDATDISYMLKVLSGRLISDENPYNVGTGLQWCNEDDRVYADLSCDMNGDLVIDDADLEILVEDILETKIGDFNLDGVKDATDRALIEANSGSAGTYADGDINGDGMVNCVDLAIFRGLPIPTINAMDFNEDCSVDFKDFAQFADEWLM
jgi:hypothetical protein